MKAEQLRIGNYVYDVDGDILQIDEITNNYVKFKNTSLRNRLVKIQPIPLTEEILLKCGFSIKLNDNGKTVAKLNGIELIAIGGHNQFVFFLSNQVKNSFVFTSVAKPLLCINWTRIRN